jgi:hypothetical protein
MARRHDDNMQGENYWQNGEALRELGIHLTIGANGQVLAIKHSKQRGVSQSLYRWNGPQPSLPSGQTRH